MVAPGVIRRERVADVLEIKIVRPYESLDEFIVGDAWTVERSGLVLLGQDAVADKTLVRFEIAIESGEAVVTGEGRAVESLAPDGEHPGGVRVEFRKLDKKSKRVLKRALEHRKSLREDAPPPPPTASAADEPEPQGASGDDISTDLEQAEATDDSATDAAGPVVADQSGVRHKPKHPVVVPDNRDLLLDRLRARAVLKAPAEPVELDEAAEG